MSFKYFVIASLSVKMIFKILTNKIFLARYHYKRNNELYIYILIIFDCNTIENRNRNESKNSFQDAD
jgi:hypothetical protein